MNQEEWIAKWLEKAPPLSDEVAENILALFGINVRKTEQGPPPKQGPNESQ